MASTVTCRAPAWLDGIAVSGAEMRAAMSGPLWTGAGIVRGLAVVQIPTPAMQVRVPAGLCQVDDGQNGFLPLELATQTDLDVTASSPTLPRIDSVIAEFVDNGASSLYRIRVVAGTAASSPVQPTLPYADQPTGKTLRLYNIAVAANATTIVNANITKQASTAVMASYGRLQNVSSDGGRPASPVVSEAIWRTDKLDTERWDGTTWRPGGLNPAYATLTRSSSQTITDSSVTPVQWNTEASDSHNGHSTSTNNSRYTVQAGQAGQYLLACSIPWAPISGAAGIRELNFKVNGTTTYTGVRESMSAANITWVSSTTRMIPLAVGDYVEATVWQNSGVSVTIDSTYANGPRLDVVWLRP